MNWNLEGKRTQDSAVSRAEIEALYMELTIAEPVAPTVIEAQKESENV